MFRRIAALTALVVFAGVLATSPAMAQDAGASDSPATTVRIKARKVETGKVEFGLELDGDREWLPRARFFPYRTATEGRWLFASPYTMSDGTQVRIQARLLANGRLEFGLQVDGDRTWLPRARFFPYDRAVVGGWLFSSPYSVRPTSGVPQSSPQSSPQGAPRNLRVAAVICDVRSGLHSVRLEWDPPAGGGGATSYEVTRLRAPHRTDNLIIADPGSDALVTGTSYVDSDVGRNELYEWSVRPRNATADATASVQLIFKPSWGTVDDPWGSRQRDCDETVTPSAGATAPGAPQNLRARHDRAGDRIIVTWSLPADDGGARITSYQVGRSRADADGPASWWTSGVTREPQSTTFDLQGATAGAFRFWVRAINSGGIGPWTSVEFILTPADDVSGTRDAPRNLRVAAAICDVVGGLHSVRLEWDPPAGGGATSYEVTRLRAPHQTSSLIITDPGSDALVTGTSHVDSDVGRNELYEWSVRPRNATAAATASVQLIFKPSWVTADDPWESRQRDCDETVTPSAGATAPGVPQNLRARHDRAGDRVIVTWSVPADDGGARITSYQVGRSRAVASGPASWWTLGVSREAQSTTFDLQGATAGAFRFWVRAVNSGGIGPWTSVEFIL